MEKSPSPHISKFLSRFTYLQKFYFIIFLFLLPVIIAGTLMVSAQNKAIYSTELELKGNTYQRALRKLMEAIPKHAWLADQLLNGNEHAKGDLLNISTDMTTDFKYLSELDQELQSELLTAPTDFSAFNLPNLKPTELTNRWDELNRNLYKNTPEESLAAHTRLLDEIHMLQQHIGETAKLVLDPSTEAHYLMVTILSDLPQAQVLIPKMVALSNDLFDKKKTNIKIKTEETALTAYLQANLETTKSTLLKEFARSKKILNDELVETKLKIPLFKYLDSADSFLNYTKEKILAGETPSGKKSDYLSLSSKALEDSYSLWDDAIDQVDLKLNARLNDLKKQKYFSILLILLFTLLGIVLGIIIIRDVSTPLNTLVDAAKRLASGNLSARVNIANKDEIGQVGVAFNQMADSFQQFINKIAGTGTQLTTSTSEIAAAAKEQEAAVNQQESTTKAIAVTAREISSTARELARTMNELNAAAEQTSTVAAVGKAGLNRMEIIMRQMVEASQNIATKLAVLSEKTGNITGVITTITKVADQTNLLSLNAAIEAEKAGEHGRTFAVIAREIRRLADQTGNATLDIEQTVNEIGSAVSAGVMSVDKFSEEIHTGVNQVSNVSEQLTKIIEQVQQQTSSFENINKSMQAQLVGAEKINDSIALLTDVSQHAAQAIRQFHNAVEQLNEVTHEMQAAVTQSHPKGGIF